MVGDDQAGRFPRSGDLRVGVYRIDLVETRRRYGRTCLAEHYPARGDLYVDGRLLGTLASTNPLREAAERVARPHACTRHEHPLDTRDVDYFERSGCVLDGDPALVKQNGKTDVSVALRGTTGSVPARESVSLVDNWT